FQRPLLPGAGGRGPVGEVGRARGDVARLPAVRLAGVEGRRREVGQVHQRPPASSQRGHSREGNCPVNTPPPRSADCQNEIYLAGLTGRIPALPMSYAELERRAAQALPLSVVSYVAGGAGDVATQRANVDAFGRWGGGPRMFVGAKQRELSVELFGMRWPAPLFMSPIGVIGICAQDGHGDLATARAAAHTGVPMVASTLTVDPLEEVVSQLGDTPGLFQLYTPTDRDLAASLVQRAEAAGFKGIVVTLDTWITGWRPRDLSMANFPQLRGLCLANYFSDPVFCSRLDKPPSEDPRAAVMLWAQVFGKPRTG